MTKVMIVEDQGLYRDLLRCSLAGSSNLEVVGAAADGETAVRLAQELQADVVIMDIDLGSGSNGIEAGLKIKEHAPEVGIVLLSAYADKAYLQAIPPDRLSGWSYLMKASVGNLDVLTRAVEGTALGLSILDPSLVAALRPKPGSRLERLTPRQRGVLDLVAQGFDNAAIAGKLFLTEKSVENYVSGLYQELDINRDGAVHPRVKAVLAYLEETRRA